MLLFSFIFIASCNGQHESTFSKESGTDHIELKAPKVDSVLQFNSMVTAIIEDSKGDFWFGSHGNGICRYDGKQFTYFTVEHGLPSTRFHEADNRKVPMGDFIRSIQEDENGNIWIQYADGFSKFDGTSFTAIYPEKENELITKSFEYTGKNSAENWQKELNHLWFGNMENNGVYRYDGQKIIHLTFPISGADNNGQRSRYATYSLYKDRDENIWFGTEGGGIFRYNGKSFICMNQHEEKGIVRGFFQDSFGKVWISNVLMGLYYYDHSAEQAGQESFIKRLFNKLCHPTF